MLEIFVQSFGHTFGAVLQILIIAAAAGILVRKNIVTEEHVKGISSIIIRVLLPCLIFSNILRQFHPSEFRFWWILPLTAVLMAGFGLLMGALIFYRELPQKKNMLSLCAIQNAGYLVLPLGATLFPEQNDKFQLYCFLYIFGANLMLWSVGRFLVSTERDRPKFKVTDIINPPLTANIAAMFFVFSGLRSYFPPVVLSSIKMLGSATVPMALFVLGAMLGGIRLKAHHHLWDIVRVATVKLVLLPAATMLALYFSGVGQINPLLAAFLVIEAASAPAAATIVQVRYYGGDAQKVCSVVLVTYLLCIFTIPLWISVWQMISA
ncbi:MAG: AEC family transporter [Phycisphaerae bacterium]|nr:AEC family transporter [Phycisphaerae bacterium]